MKNTNIIRSIIESFMRNDTPSEIVNQTFRRWLVDDGWREEKEKALEEQWDKMTVLSDALGSSDEIRKQYEVLEHSSKGRKRVHSWIPWAVSAAAAVLLCISLSLNLIRRPESQDTVCYVTGRESKGEFTLPDGSHVWLNNDTRLKFDADFAASGERKVEVDGEAFFDVVKDRTPFVVSLGDNLSVKVHGTRFNVRNSGIFESVQVVLQSGEVEVENGSYRGRLVPGNCYTWNKAMETYRISHVNTASFSNWTRPMVVFKDESLSDILVTLEHWHNVKITVEKGVDTTVSLSFTLKNEPVDETFDLLQKVTGYKCKVVDPNHIVISR